MVALTASRQSPVEFRVFVERGKVVGVSNYYCQRPLRDLLFARMAIAAADLTGQLTTFCRAKEFTADWLVNSEGSLLFLEGGPPHRKQAPAAGSCCFRPGAVHGIALENLNPIDEEA